MNCTNDSRNYSIDIQDSAGKSWYIGSVGISDNGIANPVLLNLVTTFKGDAKAKGKLAVRPCILRSALVRYSFSYATGTVTLTTDGTVNKTEKLLYPGRDAVGLGRHPSLLGGFSYALSNMFRSNITLHNSGTLALMGHGAMSYTFMSSGEDQLCTTDMTWFDPTPAILETFRELSFRAAVAFSNSSSIQTAHGS